MNRIRTFAVALAVLIALGVAPLVQAQTIKDQTETAAVTGNITALDVAAGTLTVKGRTTTAAPTRSISTRAS
jgi:hypothetical protein